MALNEACQLWIEQEIQAGLARGESPYSIGIRIAEEIKRLFEVEMQAKSIAQRARRKAALEVVTNVTKHNLSKKHTKPDVKAALNEAERAIMENEVANEDVQRLLDTVANKVADGELPPVITGSLKRAADKVNPFKKRKKGGGPSTWQQIHTDLNRAANNLMGILDSGLKPQGNDRTYYQGIRDQAPLLIMCFVQMGIDIDAVMATVRGTKKEIEYVESSPDQEVLTQEGWQGR